MKHHPSYTGHFVDLTNMSPFKTYVYEEQIALRYGRPPRVLAKERIAGTGWRLPYYIHGGRRILYCVEDCDEIVIAARTTALSIT